MHAPPVLESRKRSLPLQLAHMPDHAPKRLGAIPGFRPVKLPDGAWGSVLSDAYAAYLPAELVGRRIVVTDRRRSWTATVLAVVERSETSVIVRDSGRYAAPKRAGEGNGTPEEPRPPCELDSTLADGSGIARGTSRAEAREGPLVAHAIKAVLNPLHTLFRNWVVRVHRPMDRFDVL